MPLFAVTYTYADDSSGTRDEVRPSHVEFLRSLREGDRLVTSGPLAGPDGALLVVRGDDAGEVTAVMDGDPFHGAHLIAERTVRPWAPYFGGQVEGRE